MKILDFGSCNIDYVYDVEHIVQPGETLVAGKLSRFPGGKGLNQAIAIAKAGAKVYLAGCVGEDDTLLRPILKQAGVDTSNLLTVEEPTGQAIIQVDKNGENSIVIYRGANGAVTESYIDHVLERFNAGDILLLQNEVSNLLYLIKKASAKGMKIILNPSPFEQTIRKIDLNDLYCVMLNETEAMQWCASDHPYDFLLWARKEYPRLRAVLTLGKKGSIFLKDGELYRQQAYHVTAVDTTAAGDTFTGYFTAGLYSGMKETEILRRASAASAIAVSRKGAASSVPTYKEVEALIDTMRPAAIDSRKEREEIVKSYISAHLADVKLSDVASLLGYNEDYAGKWIQRHFDSSFSQLLQKYRCHAAAAYLENTDMTINEILEKVGYNNGSFFRKIFAQYYQVSPKEYRQKKKKL